MSSWCVVVPSHRPERILRWMLEWRDQLADRCHLIIVCDTPEPMALDDGNENLTLLSWQDFPDWIPHHTDQIRSWGLYHAWQQGTDYILTLDDDVLPTCDLLAEYERVFDQGAPLSDYLDVGALTTSGLQMRGFPYGDRKPAPVALQYGGWSGVLDYDAATQLAAPRSDQQFAPTVLAVPRGVPTTCCIMNTAWRREYTPLMWQLPLLEGRFNRFGDIWSGLFAKRVLDAAGAVMVVNGRAQVRHERASDPFVSLQREAAGNPVNEGLWQALSRPAATDDMTRAYKLVTSSAADYFARSDKEYANVFRQHRDLWLDLFKPPLHESMADFGLDPFMAEVSA